MKFIAAVLCLLTVAACGVDGEPVTPTMNAAIGVGPNGLNTRIGAGLRSGPVSVWLNF